MRSKLLIVASVVLLAGTALFIARPDRPEPSSSSGIIVIPSSQRALPPEALARPIDPTARTIRPGRDPARSAWATRSEGLLRVQFRQVPMLDVGDNLQISCVAARCRVAARLPAGLEGENRALYWRFIQGPAVRERLAELRLSLEAAELGSDDRFVLRVAKAS